MDSRLEKKVYHVTSPGYARTQLYMRNNRRDEDYHTTQKDSISV